MLTNVLDWQQRQEGSLQVKCEDITRHHHHTIFTQQALRFRARLKRNSSHSLPLCDRNGNNLLMIAPGINNANLKRHIMLLDMNGTRRIKIELEDKEKDEDKDNFKQNKEP